MTTVLEGPDDPNAGIPRRSIASGSKIPNAAIFLKRTTLEFLQILFNTRSVGSLHFEPDDTKTEIQISDVHSVDLETLNRRPAIVATRGPLSWQNIALGNVETRNMKTGGHTFNDLLVGSVAFSCISREGIEAEQIGHIVFNSFKFFRPVLQKYGFFRITSLNIGGETLVEQEGLDDKTTVVPVYVTAHIQDRWSLTEDVGRKLAQIIVESVFNTGE